MVGVGATRLWIIEAHRLRPDAGTSLIGSWPRGDVRLTEERLPYRLGPVRVGTRRAIRFEFPDRESAVLQPSGPEVNALLDAHRDGPGGIRWDDLVQVALIASSEAPSREDVYFALTYDDETTDFLALGDAGHALPKLQALPGFDNRAFEQAMNITDEAASVLWRR